MILPKLQGLTGNQLKLIAMIAMFSDHFGKMFFPSVMLFQYVGRIAFPLFAYMIAEGCRYTRNRLRYFLLIFVLGLGCSAVYFIFSSSLYQNILLTFSLSIACVFATDAFLRDKRPLTAFLMAGALLATVFLTLVLPHFVNGFAFDYDLYGALLPVMFYFIPDKRFKLSALCLILIVRASIFRGTNIFALFSLPLLLLYNGKRGKYRLKYLFYIFYPAHLVLLQALAMLIG